MTGSRVQRQSCRLPGVDFPWAGDSDSDEWYTPPAVFIELGIFDFDLDAATVPGGLPWIPATRHYSVEEDGLASPWQGLVWLNPPYSAPTPWVEKMARHGNGVALLPADTSTRLWHEIIVPTARSYCFLRGRLRFIKADAETAKTTSARFPAVLVGWGDQAAEAVVNCGLGWSFDLGGEG